MEGVHCRLSFTVSRTIVEDIACRNNVEHKALVDYKETISSGHRER